ncbi:MAG: FAD binding domain-containing protein [Acidimicrobiales bacterium]
MQFSIATTLDEALDALATGACPIAGGTDLVVAARHGKAPLPDSVVAIDRLSELQTISSTADATIIGAGVTHARLMTNDAVTGALAGLADASALVGSPATRNLGTLGGNVMNASPAMDTGAPLVVLNASVTLRSTRGERSLPVAELWVGPGQTATRPDELCTVIVIPTPRVRSGSAYVRLEYRRAMEIAVVGAAAAITLGDDGSIEALAVALTAVGPTILSVELAELVGHPMTPETLERVATLASTQSTPISDGRASDRYRRHAVGIMAKRR